MENMEEKVMIGLCRRKECKKKGIFNFANKQGLLFEKSKESGKFIEMYKKGGVSKTRENVRNVPRTQNGNEL